MLSQIQLKQSKHTFLNQFATCLLLPHTDSLGLVNSLPANRESSDIPRQFFKLENVGWKYYLN